MEESSTYQAIIEKGEVPRAHKTLLLLGTDRFGAPSAQVRVVLEGINDPDNLDHLSLHVSKVSSWEELLQQLR